MLKNRPRRKTFFSQRGMTNSRPQIPPQAHAEGRREADLHGKPEAQAVDKPAQRAGAESEGQGSREFSHVCSLAGDFFWLFVTGLVRRRM